MRVAIFALLLSPLGLAQQPIGAAQVDITPDAPVRLSGYGSRRDESDGVLQRLKATALALGEPPVLVIAVDNCGVPAPVRARVAAGLARRVGLDEVRLAIASSHTHSAPMLSGNLANLFSMDIIPEEQARIDAYTDRLVAELIEVGVRAIDARAPGALSFARDQADFAANRRTAGGPTDRDVDVLVAHGEAGELRALVVNYACHCTTLGALDMVCGDWAGYAREAVEAAHPGAKCLVTIGCGADQNPTPRGSVEHAQRYGQELAAAVERVLAAQRRPVRAAPTVGRVELVLPLAALPDRAAWEERAQQAGAVGYHAAKNLARLDRGEALPTSVDYPVQVLRFGEDLAWAFLPGEVVVDYSLRLERELDADGLIVTAYANDIPGYVPSERVLREGGYEGGSAMVYYDLPGPYAPGLEQKIVDAVRSLVPAALQRALPGDRTKSDGFAPLTPSAATAAIEMRAGLRVVLAAAEPLVVDPIAIDFAPDGALWVVEMRDYPNPGEGVPSGRIKRLIDDDGDMVFDRATVFLDDLPLPTDVKVWRDGVLICAAPNVFYAEDTNGDGVADRIETKLSGFATHNHQARVNSLRWGGDGWLYAANGLFGGTITSDKGTTLDLGSQDFRWKPDTGELEHATGLSQQGRCRDDQGRWFGCDNGNLVWHYPLDAALIASVPDLVPPPTRVNVCGDEEGAMLFPISPSVKLLLRPGTGSGRVTSACGLDVYRDTALGEDLYGDLFACEPVHNMVRRVELDPVGLTFRGQRAPDEQAREFLASRDPWFRPVQVRTGPDGALWVVDMARYVIEHPNFVSPEVLKRYDVRAGEGLGRIWRIVPKDDPLENERNNGTTNDLRQQLAMWRGEELAPGEERVASVDLKSLDSSDLYVRYVAQATVLGNLELADPRILIAWEGEFVELLAVAYMRAGEPSIVAGLASQPEPRFVTLAFSVLERSGMPFDDLDAGTRTVLEERVAAIRLQLLSDLEHIDDSIILVDALGRLEQGAAQDAEVLESLLTPSTAPELRSAAVTKSVRTPEMLAVVREAWSTLMPRDQDALRLLIAERPWAQKLWGEERPAPTPPEAITEFLRLEHVDDLVGDTTRGREQFQSLCATCHSVDGLGEALGPDLAALTDRSTPALLVALIEPSRQFLAPYQDYVLSTTDGRVLGGMVYDEGETFVRLRAADGRVQTAVRSSIDELRATGRSFMPEGLLVDRSPQDVADLLAFLREPRTPPKVFAGNQPAAVRAGAGGEWHLTAATAAIFGPELAYEQPTDNLGYWHTAQDHATWTVVVDEPTEVEVWLEWACADSSAGETFVLEGAGAVLRGEVAGTGPDWSNYTRVNVGQLTLPAGQHRFECRAAADPARSLFDLRRFSFVPVK